MSGRPAALPQAGYRLPQRLFTDDGQCRVQFFPESGGNPVDINLSVLPVARELREWMALGVLGVTGPSGTRRTTASAIDTMSILKRFTRYLASLQNPPTRPEDLRAVHLDGYVLAGGPHLHRDTSALRSILRFAPVVSPEFAARLAQLKVPKSGVKVPSYTEPEFRRITAKARSDLRTAAVRIRTARQDLQRWRDGEVGQADRAACERGWLLDYIDRHGDVPRYENAWGTRAPEKVRRAGGGINASMANLHLTHSEIGAAGTLLICLTGQNFSTVAQITSAHHRPDAHAGGTASAVLDLVKPRRGSRRAAMSVQLPAVPPDRRENAREDLNTPFGVYTLLLELAAPARVRLGSDSLFAFYCSKGPQGRGFRDGLPKQVLQFWGKGTGLVCDAPDPVTGAPVKLHIDGRRLRMSWLELHQRPVAHTEATLANEYLARNRGNLAEYQRVVADVLDDQVVRARATAAMSVLTEDDVRQSRTDPEAVAARHRLDAATLQRLIAGRLDTVLAGCTDHLSSPFAPAGKPCTASFLLCLNCPCARATPAHLPVQTLALDALLARRQEISPLKWAQQCAEPVTRLQDLLTHFTPTAVADARAAATPADHELVERFLTRGLDLS